MKQTTTKILIALLLALVLAATGCGSTGEGLSGGDTDSPKVSASVYDAIATEEDKPDNSWDAAAIPEYTGQAYVTVNGNEPQLDDSLKNEESFEEYGNLDKHGRCTYAIANLSTDTQPAATEERGDISSIHPSGWQSDMGWERCHLIGWQLSAENANARNLVTGTHYMNVSGMLPFENKVDDYLERSGNHVLYEVTPIFEGKNMVCSGIHMQAESVEDDGNGISFNVFCFNVSPGRSIDYKSGIVTTDDEEVAAANSSSRVYIVNVNTGKFHYPTCGSVAQMSESNKMKVTKNRDTLIQEGYSPCGNCNP